MRNQVFIAQGDITRLQADAIAVTQGIAFNPTSPAFVAFLRHAAREGNFLAAYQQARQERADPDKAFFVPCSATRAPHGIVFVLVATRRRGSDDPDDPAADAVAAAIQTAVSGLRAQGRTGHLLIALVGFRLGRGGDQHDRLRSARAQVRAAFDRIESLPEVDVAFVLPDASTYAIFRDARRKEQKSLGIAAQPFPKKELAPLVAALQNGECVLFAGAGMSQNANLTSYPELIQQMASELGVTAPLPDDLDAYLDVAQWYHDSAVRDGEPEKVARLIRERFARDGVHPSLAHYLLLSLPVRFCITTNYDRLQEDTLRALRRFPIRVVSAEQVARTGYRDATFVVKLHGDAEEGNAVLTREDYDTFFQRRPEMAALLEGLLLNQTFFFVGYSLRDPDFRQIFAKIGLMLRNAKQPTYVATFGETPPYLRHYYERSQIRLIELDAATTAPLTPTERKRLLIAFLDRLAEEVHGGGNGNVFLARDRHHPVETEEGHRLQTLRHRLREVGEEVQAIIRDWSETHTRGAGAPPLDDIRIISRLLASIAEQGWRPIGKQSLTVLWEEMAALVEKAGGSEHERRQMLISALRYAETDSAATRLERKIGVGTSHEIS